MFGSAGLLTNQARFQRVNKSGLSIFPECQACLANATDAGVCLYFDKHEVTIEADNVCLNVSDFHIELIGKQD